MALILAPILNLYAQEGQIEEKPRWAPRSEEHMNVYDELGRKQGLWKYYSINKILVLEITFLNDIKHGPSIRHNSYNGVIIEESNYFNGKRDGDYKRYNYAGSLIKEGQYENGKKSGTWVTYYSVNGEKRTEGDYKYGLMEGYWKYYSSKGVLRAEGEYKNGKREGTWKFHSSDGRQTEERKFSNGSEVGVVTNQPVKKKNNPKGTTPNNQQNQQNQQNQGNQQNQNSPDNQGNQNDQNNQQNQNSGTPGNN